MQVACVSAEQFTNEFVSAVRERRNEEFRNKYRNLDVLLIDDISFFSGKEQTEECFFHTFNELHNAAHQIVITSNQLPKAMLLTEERLRSRFEWGLVVDIKPPDLPTRLAILQAKARQKGTDIAVDVLELLAEQAKQNIRELEGSLNRIIAYAKLLRASPTREMAELALESIGAREPAIEASTPTLLLNAVAESFRLTVDDLKSPRRDKEAALARRVAMYLLRQETSISVTQIGAELGGRDASAVTHACQKLTSELESNQFLKHKIEDVRKRLFYPPANPT
jgi:chromosomal replication initiator protein